MVPAVPRPAWIVAHIPSTSTPAGVFTPMPVTTTRGRACESRRFTMLRSRLRGDFGHHEVDGLADGADVLEILFGHRNVEPLLEPHHEFDEVEAVGVEILLEAGVLDDRVGIDAQHLDRDLSQCGECFLTFHGSSCRVE